MAPFCCLCRVKLFHKHARTPRDVGEELGKGGTAMFRIPCVGSLIHSLLSILYCSEVSLDGLGQLGALVECLLAGVRGIIKTQYLR